MTDTVKVESPVYFSINQVAHKRRLAAFLSRGAAPESLAMFCGKTDGQRAFHEIIVRYVRQNARQDRCDRFEGSLVSGGFAIVGVTVLGQQLEEVNRVERRRRASDHELWRDETCSLGHAFDATALTLYGLAVDYSKIITVEPGKRSGKPCIRGLRITVYDVLDYLASGMTHEQILRDFPYLTEEDIQACLAFAADRERRTSFVAGEAPVR